MFDNIGDKIKTLAEALCWIGIVVSVIAAIGFFISGNGITGLSMLIAGPLGSWISSFALYALGEITENSATQTQLLTKLAQKEGIELPVLKKESIKLTDQFEDCVLLISNYEVTYSNEINAMLLANGIAMELKSSLMKDSIYVHPSDFQRARALIAEAYKDNIAVLKGLAPEQPAED